VTEFGFMIFDAAAALGNSGSPVMNLDGEVVSGENVCDRRVLERQVGVHPFQLRVLGFELTQPLHIRDGRTRVLARHLKKVALLIPCLRSRSATGTPASASFRIATIWLSLNFDFRMTAPEPGAVYFQVPTKKGSLRVQ